MEDTLGETHKIRFYFSLQLELTSLSEEKKKIETTLSALEAEFNKYKLDQDK